MVPLPGHAAFAGYPFQRLANCSAGCKSALSNHKRETLWLFPGHKAWPSWLDLIIHTLDTWAWSSAKQLPYKSQDRARTSPCSGRRSHSFASAIDGLCHVWARAVLEMKQEEWEIAFIYWVHLLFTSNQTPAYAAHRILRVKDGKRPRGWGMLALHLAHWKCQCPDLQFMELIKQSVLYGDTPHYDWLASPMTIRILVPRKGTLLSGMSWKASIKIQATQRYIWWAFRSR